MVETKYKSASGPDEIIAKRASALPMMLVGMPGQVRLASREPQPTPFVPKGAKGKKQR
jgi:hypothetical protein